MVGLAEISAGFGSLKAIKDIVQGLNAATVQASINEIKIELQSHILEAQHALFLAQQTHESDARRIAALEKEIVSLKDWEAEKKRYQFSAIGKVGFAYTLKDGMENGEPMHWLCQPCFEAGHKVALQFISVTQTAGGQGMKSNWKCGRCESILKAGMSATPSDPSTW